MDDLLNKIERQYGDFALVIFLLCVSTCSVILMMLWVASVAIFGWPILLPFIIAGYMLYKVNQGEPK